MPGSASDGVLTTHQAIEMVQDFRAQAEATLQVLRVLEEDLVEGD